MTHIHLNVLDPNQASLIPLLSGFAHSFYVAGGTALALQYGHKLFRYGQLYARI